MVATTDSRPLGTFGSSSGRAAIRTPGRCLSGLSVGSQRLTVLIMPWDAGDMPAARLAAVGTAIVLAGTSATGIAAAPPDRGLMTTSRRAGCSGAERWKIKTLTDADAGSVNKTATTTTVMELRANDTRPEKVSSNGTRIKPVEFRRYRIHATLRKALREDDGDLHVVIADPSHDAEADPTETMIIEFPDTACEPQKSSSYAPQMGAARAELVALVKRCTGYSGNFGVLRLFKLHATVTGVGFWDVKHGTPQLGHAPNDIEIHPVLTLTHGTCH